MSKYDDEVAKMPRRRATSKEAQQWRYGSALDEKRHAFWESVRKYVRYIGAAVPIAAAISSIVKAWWHS